MVLHRVSDASGRRHLLGIEGLAREDVERLLDLAGVFFEANRQPTRKAGTLRGKSVINVFYEASTRTRTSFELAGKRLSADVVNISAQTSSVTKGETLYDTMKTLEAMHPDVMVIRHPASGAPHWVSEKLGVSIVNAGDGAHEHPTQALLDAATIRRHKGKVDGLEVVIVGDVAHSRVARSNILCLAKLGARIRLCAPRTLMPRGIEEIGGELTRERVRVLYRLEDGLDGADVVMMLRVQNERREGEACQFPNTRELSRTFGLSERTLAYAKPDAIVMHPGPMNRGVEISPQVADGPRAVILSQVSWGVAMRMAVLERAVLGEAALA